MYSEFVDGRMSHYALSLTFEKFKAGFLFGHFQHRVVASLTENSMCWSGQFETVLVVFPSLVLML